MSCDNSTVICWNALQCNALHVMPTVTQWCLLTSPSLVLQLLLLVASANKGAWLLYELASSEFKAHRPQGVEDARQSLWSQEARLAAGMPPATSTRILEAVSEYLQTFVCPLQGRCTQNRKTQNKVSQTSTPRSEGWWCAADGWISVTVCPTLCDARTEPMGLTPNPMDMKPVMIAVRLPFLSWGVSSGSCLLFSAHHYSMSCTINCMKRNTSTTQYQSVLCSNAEIAC